jgi:iron complex outermembrane recepter protein
MKPTLTRASDAAASGMSEKAVSGLKRALMISSIAGASLMMTAMPSLAQVSTPADGAEVDDSQIVITADKRSSTTVLATPTSIQAISGEALQEQGVAGFADIAGQIPGLVLQDLGPGDRKYIIRGISSTGQSTTGVYYDEAVISGSNANDGGGFQSDIRLYDLDHIEVLRGPQGTLYGAGSMSGTVRFITNRPDLDEVGGYITGEISDTSEGAENYNANGALNLPIVEGVAALRLVGWGISDSGFIDQVRVGATLPNERGFVENVNNEDVLGGRASLRVQPNTALTLDLSYTRQHSESNGSSRYTPEGVTAFDFPPSPIIQGCDLCNTDISRSPRTDDAEVYSLTATYDASFGTFTATTNQFNRDFEYNIDQSAILATFSVFIPAEVFETVGRRVNSSEIRFASDFDSPVNFVAGLYRQEETSDLDIAMLTTNGDGVPTGSFSRDDSQDALLNPGVGSTLFGRTDHRESTQYAVFGEATWQATPRLELSAGLRYFEEEMEGVQETTHGFGGGPTAGPIADDPQSNDKVTGKLNLAYRFNEDLLFYATVAQGFRSGGLNARNSIFEVIPPSFGPDSLIDYEAGIKGRLFDGLLEYQVNAFFIDWSDIQVQQVTQVGALHYTGNAGNAESKGIEFEFVARPTDALRINFAGSFQDAFLTEGATPDQYAANSTLGLTGDQMPDVAPFQFALGLNYTVPLSASGDWNGTLAADISYQGERNAYFESSPFNLTLDDYTLLNLRAAVSNDVWSATLFARNATDERAQISAINSNQDPHALTTVRPRTIGIAITRDF